MSIINQMLQDLDKRRAINEVMPEAVRPLPAAPRNVLPASAWLWGGIALLIIAAGIAYLTWTLRSPSSNAALVVAQAAPLNTPIHPVVTPPEPAKAQPSVNASAEATLPQSSPVAEMATVPTPTRPESKKPIIAADEPRTPALQRPLSMEAEQGVVHAETEPALAAAPARATVTQAERIGKSPSPSDARIEKKMRASTPRERAEADYQRGVNLLNNGRGPEAITAFTAALREDGAYDAARPALASLLIEQRQLDEAQSVLQEGLAHELKQPALAVMLARLQVERGDPQAAANTLAGALPAATNKAEYRALYAAILQRAGRPEEATEHYVAALKLAPGNGVWWMGLAISLEAEGRMSEAREAFQSAKASGSLSSEVAAYVEQRLRQLP
jgi:MSHA biogenesis protein MshN